MIHQDYKYVISTIDSEGATIYHTNSGFSFYKYDAKNYKSIGEVKAAIRMLKRHYPKNYFVYERR